MTKRTFRLQISDRGSWRDAILDYRDRLNFDHTKIEGVCAHAQQFFYIPSIELRVLDPDGATVLWWTEERGWHNALERQACQ